MSTHIFYSTENDNHHRELTIVNAALLVSKPPTKEKRIRIKVRMLLSGQSNAGAPDWLDSAYVYCAQWHDSIVPSVDFSGYDLQFSADTLFDQDGAKAPRCQMRSFEIHECGDSESPDVAVTFTIYANFSSKLWEWLGMFGGDACFCSFTPSVPGLVESSHQPGDVAVVEGNLLGDGEEEEEEDEPEFDEDVEDEEEEASAGGRSGPKELAAYHESVVQGEVKKGRGRPRKVVDPLTVQEPAVF